MTVDDLRADAEACRQSSQGNGDYNTAFWVASIVLENMARRLEVAGTTERQPEPREEPISKDTQP